MLLLPVLSCGQSGNQARTPRTIQSNHAQRAFRPSRLFTLKDAEEILGEKAYRSDSAWNNKAGVSTYSCAYTANATDEKSGRTVAVYCLFERYAKPAGARNRYSFIKKANEENGIQELHDLGDEAYFHTDNNNFYFVMVRKGDRVFNLKVNKITSRTSLPAFNSVASKITAGL